MKNDHAPLTAAEYFAGIGLVRMGLEPCDWQIPFANDISEKKYKMYRTFFPEEPNDYKIGDIFEIDPVEIPQTLLATCSFPCVDLSLAGNMNGIHGRHSSAFWGFVRILQTQEEKAPPLILVENVPGWLHSNDGADFRTTLQALNQLGYACDVFTLDALRFTPQSRPRIFLIGCKFAGDESDPNILRKRSSALLSEQLKKSIFANSDLPWLHHEIPEPPPLRTSGLSTIIERLADTDERWWSEEQVKRHLAMMESSHYERVATLMNCNRISYRTFFRRIRAGQQRAEVRHDDLSGCLRTAVGGSGKQFLIQAGCGVIKMRTMTAREYARLQGVPDQYQITIDGVQALTGFGDAVCVPAITWVAKHVLQPIIEG